MSNRQAARRAQRRAQRAASIIDDEMLAAMRQMPTGCLFVVIAPCELRDNDDHA